MTLTVTGATFAAVHPHFEIPACDRGLARSIASQLGIDELAAVMLARRGIDSVTAAERFIAADETHAPELFEAMPAAVAAIRGAIDAGERITVHGDYDVDGVCATAILVSTLRGLGAEVDWFIPERNDGYGLGAETVELLAERGTGLIVTVDCGVGSIDEVDLALDLGLGVVVTDHHRHGEKLPACPIVHPAVDTTYPYEFLCGAGVADKVAVALRGGEDPERDLDMVALATVADMVPLTGENRALVRKGLLRMRRAGRKGLRALMRSAAVQPEAVNSGDLGFRVAPRINAAGRLYRADAGVELMLCEDETRAAEIADELERVNSERRMVERDVFAQADKERRQLADTPSKGMVVAGEGWHAGVVGIVAARLMRESGWPAVVATIDGDGRARASARSIPGVDLVDVLTECASHLDKYGGHAAAAGLELDAGGIGAFADAFAAAVTARVGDEPPVQHPVVDIVCGAGELDLALARQLESFGPYGMGNPAPLAVVPGATIEECRSIGADGTHARFTIASREGGKVGGVGFSVGADFSDRHGGTRVDAAVRIEVNRFNGAETAQARLEQFGNAWTTDAQSIDPPPGLLLTADEWDRRYSDHLVAGPVFPELNAGQVDAQAISFRDFTRGSDLAAVVADMAADGGGVLVLAGDVSAITGEVAGAAALTGRSVAMRSLGLPTQTGEPGAEIAAWDWELFSTADADAFASVVLADPPPTVAHAAAAFSTGTPDTRLVDRRPAALSRAQRAIAGRWPGRDELVPVFRLIRDELAANGGAGITPARMRQLWQTEYGPVSPEVLARRVRILVQAGSVEMNGDEAGAVSSRKVDLSASPDYREFERRRQEALEFLSSRQAPPSPATDRSPKAAA